MDSAVPDVLGPGVRLVFVGINPGLRSAQAGHHFANPRNDFWRLLHDSGLTPQLLDPSEEAQLLGARLGITNAAMRVTRGSGELRRTDFAGAVDRLSGIEQTISPAGFAFVGKQAYCRRVLRALARSRAAAAQARRRLAVRRCRPPRLPTRRSPTAIG